MAKREDKPEVRRRKRRRRGAFYAPTAFLLMFLAIIIGLSAFFRISDMIVSGQGIYTAEEIIAASGIEIGDNLIFIDEAACSIKLHNELVYIDEVKITRVFPNSVKIEITESFPIASIAVDGFYWLLDKNCKLLEKTNAVGAGNSISISGITLTSPTAGQKIDVPVGSETQLSYLKEILNQILYLDMHDKITWLDMNNIANITFDFEGRFTVKLGTGDNVDYKLQLLADVVSQKLDEHDEGVIDLSTDKEAHFTPN